MGNSKKILVLTDKYFPRPYANAMCAQELIRVWTRRGDSVDVLAYDDFDGTPDRWEDNAVYYVKPDERLRLFYYADTYRNTPKGKTAHILANILSKVKGTILLPWQPFYSFSFPRRIYKKMCELQEKNCYDGVIAILNPFDSNIAACKFKAKYPDVPYVVFCVDTLRKTFVDQHISKTFADAFIWEKKILENCDAYFYMHSRKGDYELSRYDPYRSKLRESDMPRFKVRDIDKIPRYDFGEDGEHWVYAGSIGGPHYNPNQLLEIFKKIENSPKRVLHLYTRGAEEDRIAVMANKEKLNVRVHGYVDAATLESIMATADVIVSLKTSGQISAKIFECMSYGKPIVHFSGQKNDPNVYYLEKYILGNIVKMYEENQESELNKLVQFLENSAGKQVDPTELKKTFETSTPEYSAERIVEEITRVKNA